MKYRSISFYFHTIFNFYYTRLIFFTLLLKVLILKIYRPHDWIEKLERMCKWVNYGISLLAFCVCNHQSFVGENKFPYQIDFFCDLKSLNDLKGNSSVGIDNNLQFLFPNFYLAAVNKIKKMIESYINFPQSYNAGQHLKYIGKSMVHILYDWPP